MSKYILAHDLGTSGNKASLFSEEGQMIGSKVFSYDVHYFNGTWAEQNPEDWWKAVCETSKMLIEESKISKEDIAVVSFSGQMMGCVCVDKQGNPLRPAIIWADQRAQKEAEKIDQLISQEEFYKTVGHRNTASYGMQKLMWIKENEPMVYKNTYKCLNAKDFIVCRLTGTFYTDCSDANNMACFDLNHFTWSDKIVEYAGIDYEKLPEIRNSTFIAGEVTPAASEATGLKPGTLVVIGAGDGVTANVGTGSISPGKTYSCMGTSAWITTTSEKPIYDPEMRTVTWAHAVPGLYAPNGTMQTAGGAYSWLKNNICQMENYIAKQKGCSPFKLIDEEIEKSKVGSHGIVFLPYLLGERAPRWNVDAKGAFIGIKSENTRGDMLRSVLEGVTMNLDIVLQVLRTQVEINEITVIGGGAKGKIWRQIMADIYNTDIIVPTLLEEAGAMGAAVIGGVGAGLFKDFTAIDAFLEIQDTQKPNPEAVEAYLPYKTVFNECYFGLEKVFTKMSKLS